jgi:pSer/pThr/pTyr-binding forkhead associated (FHA) protein
VTIGRDAATNQLGLNDGNVSARHCEVRPIGPGFELVDLDAKNGTFVNEISVKQTGLSNGDVISLGETRIYLGLS